MADEDDDRYRWCVYCKADCHLHVDDQEHGAACPVTTGLWPLGPLGGGCWNCSCPDCMAARPLCAVCNAPFSQGEEHALLDEDMTRPARPDDDVRIVVCIGCAADIEVRA